MPSLSWMEETKEIKTNNFVLSKRLAEPACLAALWSAAACVSGIVLEAGVQKQQGAEDKQAVRDSLNTATVASTVEGCEDLCSNRPINPPYQLERASVRLTPHQRLAATRHIWDVGLSSLQTPQTYIRALMDSYGTISSTSRFKTGKMCFRGEEGRTCCHSTTAQVIPSLYYEQHMSWSISTRPECHSRERENIVMTVTSSTTAEDDAVIFTYQTTCSSSLSLFKKSPITSVVLWATRFFSHRLTGPSPVRLVLIFPCQWNDVAE